jgi:hypothetical protein
VEIIFITMAALLAVFLVTGRRTNQKCGQDKYARAQAKENYEWLTLLAVMIVFYWSVFTMIANPPALQELFIWLGLIASWIAVVGKSIEKLFSGASLSKEEWMNWREEKRQEWLLERLEKEKKLPKVFQDKLVIRAAEEVQRERRRRALTDLTYWEEDRHK